MKSLLFTLLSFIQISSFAFDDVCKLSDGNRIQISREATSEDEPNDLLAYAGTNHEKSEYAIFLEKDLKLKTITLPARNPSTKSGEYKPTETIFSKPGRCYAARVSVNFTKHGNVLVVSCMSTNANLFKTYAIPLECGY